MNRPALARGLAALLAPLLALPLAGCGGAALDVAGAFAGPGPALSVAPDAVASALNCTPASAVPAAPTHPVLLVHGTGLTADESWTGNYATVLPALGYDTCTITLPDRALGDIQVASEYVVAAIRTLNRRYGDAIDVVTHSQGGLEARWALQWWPDLAARVDDLVSLAATNHGTPTANTLCLQDMQACTAAIQQQRVGSNFLAALNAHESVPAGVSYTSIYSLTDEIVTTLPPDYSPAVAGATNLLVQDICPGLPVTHLEELTSGVVFALVLDAFTHAGTADPARIDAATACTQLVAPGVTPNAFLAANGTSYLAALQAVASGQGAPEPAVAAYAGSP